MASFQKRGKTWQYTISRMINGKQKPIRKGGFKTKKEAQVAAAEVEAELAKGYSPHLNPEPFDEYFSAWVKLYKSNIAKNTMAHYKRTLNIIQNYFGGKPIQDITKRDYQKFLNEYGTTRSKETMQKLNTHIRACVREAVDEGIIRTDFTRGVVLNPGNSAKKAEEKYLNYYESKLLLKEVLKNLDKGLSYYLILLGLTSGMRYAEMVGLTRKDFDFVNNTVNVDKTWGYTKEMPDGFGPTKNQQSVRKISLEKFTMEVFKNLFDSTPNNIYRLVFYSADSKYKVITNAAANKCLTNLLKRLKIEAITLHGLRHTHASVCLYEGATVNYVAERLGHGDVETTYKTYLHVINELRHRDEEKVIKAFERMYV